MEGGIRAEMKHDRHSMDSGRLYSSSLLSSNKFISHVEQPELDGCCQI